MTIAQYNKLCAGMVTAVTLADNIEDVKSRFDEYFDNLCELYRNDDISEAEYLSLTAVLSAFELGYKMFDNNKKLACIEETHINKAIERLGL